MLSGGASLSNYQWWASVTGGAAMAAIRFLRLVGWGALFVGALWASAPGGVQAEAVTETFQLTLTGKEWCRDSPKFSVPFNFTTKAGFTLAMTRDPLNTGDVTDIHATIGHTGIATIDATLLTGRAFRVNSAGSVWELALSGVDPHHPLSFLTLRGKASRNKAGLFTKVSGTVIFRLLDKINGAQDVECFANGTFRTGGRVETIALGTPYVNALDIASINEAFSATASAPWGFVHNGIDFMPGGNLAPFQAAASGIVEDVRLWQNNRSGNWQVNLKIRKNDTFVMDYAFEPMSSLQSDGQTQLTNMAVTIGQVVSHGDLLGKLVKVGDGAHVHFSLVQNHKSVCPEPFFIPEAQASIMAVIHDDHPTWNMCY